MANRQVLLILCSLAILRAATADGYPKEGPSSQQTPMEMSSSAEGMTAQPSSAVNPAPPQNTQAVANPHSGLYPGLAPWLYAGQYPAVSTDYVSRYYGPIAVPTVLPDGTIADTPAVVAARAAHLAALNQAKALWYGKVDDGSYNPYKYGDYAAQYYPGSVFNRQYLPALAQGSLNKLYLDTMAAHSPLNKQYLDSLAGPSPLNKQFLDTLAAQSPLNKHYLEALAAQGTLRKGYQDALAALAPSNQQYLNALALQGGLNKPYFGPLANPLVLPSGYLADTAEVAALRAAHLVTLQRAQEDAALWRSQYKQAWQ